MGSATVKAYGHNHSHKWAPPHLHDHEYSEVQTVHLPCVSSLIELIQGGDGALSVLRTFRLLRILKVVRFLPALKYQLVVMIKTMDNVATFFALLVLFIFIFRLAAKIHVSHLVCQTL